MISSQVPPWLTISWFGRARFGEPSWSTISELLLKENLSICRRSTLVDNKWRGELQQGGDRARESICMKFENNASFLHFPFTIIPRSGFPTMSCIRGCWLIWVVLHLHCWYILMMMLDFSLEMRPTLYWSGIFYFFRSDRLHALVVVYVWSNCFLIIQTMLQQWADSFAPILQFKQTWQPIYKWIPC